MNMCIYVCYVYMHNVIYVKVAMYERKVDILEIADMCFHENVKYVISLLRGSRRSRA